MGVQLFAAVSFGGWLAQAPLGLLLLALVVAGLGVPFPEDIALLLAGALVARSELSLVFVIVACAAGVMAGDILLFLSARHLGARALDRWPFKKVLPPARRARLEAMFARRGNVIVFTARHVAGLRAPVFALAGIHHMPLGTFIFWDGLGMCISVPVMVTLGFEFAQHLDRVRAGLAEVQHWLLFFAALALAIYLIVRHLRRPKRAPGS